MQSYYYFLGQGIEGGNNNMTQIQTKDLLAKLDKLDSRLDKLETNLAVMNKIVSLIQEDIRKVDATHEQQIKDIKARFWSMLTIYVTTTSGFLVWTIQEVLKN